jgi:hypothetical protein
VIFSLADPLTGTRGAVGVGVAKAGFVAAKDANANAKTGIGLGICPLSPQGNMVCAQPYIACENELTQRESAPQILFREVV